MREVKEKGATGFPSTAAPGVGNPDKVAKKTTNDNLSLEDKIVKEAKDFMLNMDLNDLLELGLTREQMEIMASPDRFDAAVRKIVRKRKKIQRAARRA